ncbi:hypothetical protein CRE_00837 [Caenorhabditis remanei]|uniref:Uncharacterized protein n=1 Tax=Caenorhabditis remanei TaxID=31234 RepID=E3LEL8_CAERE|nr:hypothetical protein CRE_00837 [Caenorhabditis remanei]
MTEITIRLVGEKDDRLFKGIEVDSEIMYSDLKRRIETETKIPACFQQVEFRGKKLPVVERPVQDINVGEEIVVSHTDLPWWEQYKKYTDIALKPSREQLWYASYAVRIHKRLMKNSFFMVYCGFNCYQMENHHKIASEADEDIQLMREATKNHFLQQHYKLGAEDETDFGCRFEARPIHLGGSRKNTIAYVKLHGQNEETKFNIKYFATRWEDNYIPLSGNTEEAVGVDVLVQILQLGTFLFIDDLHSDNSGYWKDTKQVAIVDFMPKAFVSFTNVKRAFFYNDLSVYRKISHIDTECDEATRIDVAKKWLKKWDLLCKIDLAIEQITPDMED